MPLQDPQLLHTRSGPPERTVGLTDEQVRELSDEALPRRQIVFPDPLAFRYLEDDPCVQVIERRGILRGYELYLVEQWACSRQSPTLVVVTYTGDESHYVVVGVLSIPEDEARWSTKLNYYLKATLQYHARPKKTELGELIITNLSSFPSTLTVIPVPDGDIRNHRLVFVVNENLKRLGCSGRSGLTLTDPTQATQKKFQSLYKTSSKIPFMQSVTELVKLCQVALCLFEMLDYEYIDGLLCDVTEAAIGNWWTEVGAEHYNFEPTDGILGPTTVAALLGMLLGSRNRLHWCGAPVTKDVFDIDGTKRGISYFQRVQKLDKTRRLDRQTLFRLQTVTAKAAAGEGWGVQKAVKSTVTEIGGKRGEIVMDMVSGKDKGGLADIETLDIDKFISLVYGERPKWLWHGKPRRTQTEPSALDPDMSGVIMNKDNVMLSPPKKIQSLPLEEELELKRRHEIAYGVHSPVTMLNTSATIDNAADKDDLRRTVFKSVAGKMSDARSGLGRIKDAVGGSRRGHGRGLSTVSIRDDYGDAPQDSAITPSSQDPSLSVDPAMAARAFTWKNTPEEYLTGVRKRDTALAPGFVKENLQSRDPSSSDQDSWSARKPLRDLPRSQDQDASADVMQSTDAQGSVVKLAPASVRSETGTIDLPDTVVDTDRQGVGKIFSLLHRRCSLDDAKLRRKHVLNENRWPRRTSFSDAEEAVLGWDEIADVGSSFTGDETAHLKALHEMAARMKHQVEMITHEVEPWVKEKIELVINLDERYAKDKEHMESTYAQLNEACQRVKTQGAELLSEERTHLMENVKEVEACLARLEYEINVVVQKVQDVEDGVRDLERQVEDVERRASDLKVQLETESWLHWSVRTLTGIGTGPNITRERKDK